MKAESMKERPDYELFKQNDVISFYHLQLPRWLVEDSRYMALSIEAKFTYTMLFNRFQLSKHNGWINDKGEVFVIYTRKELSERLNISEKRVSAAMNELKEYMLIWERRCGRGFANQIYLANVQISLADAVTSKGEHLNSPPKAASVRGFDDSANDVSGDMPDDTLCDAHEPADMPNESTPEIADSRTDETAVLDFTLPKRESALYVGNINSLNEPGFFLPLTSVASIQEPPNRSFKNRQISGSKTVESAVQEPPYRPPSNKEHSNKELSTIEHSYYNRSQSMSSPYNARAQDDRRRESTVTGTTDKDWARLTDKGRTRPTNTDIIKRLLNQAELDTLPEDDSAVMKDAIERLYFMQSIRVGNAVYPNDRIRSHLWRLNGSVVEDAVYKITRNTTVKIRNSSAYVVTVLFNSIMEAGSDLMVDTYLNYLRSIPVKESGGVGGG